MTLSGTLATAICGYLANIFKANQNPIMYGRILAGVNLFSYLGSIPCFWLAGYYYKKHL
jgi:hypothetical protein